jgi:prophage antirepressor-like protein
LFFKKTIQMNQLINLSGDYVTFDVGEKKKQKVKIVGTFKQPYFCGKDVCEILGYVDIKDALQTHVKPKNKKDLKTLSKELVDGVSPPTFFGYEHFKNLTYNAGKAVYVNEPGLYALIMKSKAPFAEAFQDLVYEVILPSIRQHGTYTLEKEFEEKLAIAEQKAIKSDLEKEEAVQKQHQANLEKEEALKLRRVAEFRALTLNKLCINYSERVKTQVFYIVTSKAFSKDNEFKIGGVDSVAQLKKRLSVYNSGNSGVHPELQMYFVFLIEVANFKQMESRMKELLIPFRSKRNANTENFNIHFDILKPLTELVSG